MSAFDFAPLLAPGLPPPAAKWNGLAKYSFVGGNNDPDQVPVDGADQGDERRAGARGQGPRDLRSRQRAAGLSSAARISGAEAQAQRRHRLRRRRDPHHLRLAAGARSGQRHLCWRAATPSIIEQECYQGSLNRLTRLGVNAVGIPLDRDGMRMDALAAALDDLKRRGVRPKYIYTIPTVQNPTGTILSEARRHELLRLACRIRRADLRGRLLCRSDLGRQTAAGAVRHEQRRRRHSYRLVLQVDRAGVARRLHRRRMAAAVAHAGDQDRRRLRRARTNGARRILPGAIRRPCAGADARLARKARNA